jgi:hypothetical protein
MQLQKAPGPSGITIDMIRNWYHLATDGTNPYQKASEIWNKIVELIKYAFTEGDIPIYFSYGILVLILKAEHQGFRRIAYLKQYSKLFQ